MYVHILIRESAQSLMACAHLRYWDSPHTCNRIDRPGYGGLNADILKGR